MTAPIVPLNPASQSPKPHHVSSHVIEVTDATFEAEVLKSDVPVLVDFWAPWCEPCRAAVSAVEQTATKYSGRLKVAKLNFDDNPNIINAYEISGIPTFMIFNNGQVIAKIEGFGPSLSLSSFVEKHGVIR